MERLMNATFPYMQASVILGTKALSKKIKNICTTVRRQNFVHLYVDIINHACSNVETTFNLVNLRHWTIKTQRYKQI